MKRLILIAVGLVTAISWNACKRADATCIDLDSGQTITIEKDSVTGKMVNAETHKPVRLYVDKTTRDTIYGVTGEVVNNKITRTEDGKYVYAGEYKNKGENYKEKYEDGDYKIKGEDYKKKVDADGDVKIKTGDTKIKIDGETGERKVKRD